MPELKNRIVEAALGRKGSAKIQEFKDEEVEIEIDRTCKCFVFDYMTGNIGTMHLGMFSKRGFGIPFA